MITQESLKSQIIKALWQLIIEGEIIPNEPMREVQLAELLNISRTPLRDALQQLEWEGIVVSEPRKGYRLAQFSEADIFEIYPLRAKLESFALELSGVPDNIILNELTEINLKILNSESPKKVVELDEKWHLLLISNCSNQRLMKMIKTLHRQSQRYEYAYMAMNKTVEKSGHQHENIIQQLQNGQLKEAVELLAENNVVGMDTLINWLKSKKNKMRYSFFLLIAAMLSPQIVPSCTVHKRIDNERVIVDDSLTLKNNRNKFEENAFKKLTGVINQYAEDEINKGNISSLALAVYRNGQVFQNYYGEIDKNSHNKPNDHTLYEIASISKVFVGSLTAKAVLEGKIKLEDDIRTYLTGEYQNLEYENTPITIKNLLTHTLGFKIKVPPKLEEVNRKTSEGYYENRPFDYDMSDFLEELKTVELDKKPGTFYDYNSIGSELLAYILEQVYHQTYHDLLQNFLSELRMENTYLQDYQKYKLYLSNSYTDSGKRAPLDKNPLLGGGYGIITTLPDLIKLMKFQLESDNPLIKESRRILYEDHEDNVMGYLWQDLGVGKEEGFYYSKTGDSYGVRSGILICPDSNYGQIIIINNKSDEALADWELLYNKIETDLIKFPKINLKSILKSEFINNPQSAKKQFNILSKQGKNYFNTNLADALNSLGYDLLYGDKEIDKSIELFEFATNEYPMNANLFDSLGEAYFIKKEYRKAESNYKKSLKLNPNNTNAKEMLLKIENQIEK